MRYAFWVKYAICAICKMQYGANMIKCNFQLSIKACIKIQKLLSNIIWYDEQRIFSQKRVIQDVLNIVEYNLHFQWRRKKRLSISILRQPCGSIEEVDRWIYVFVWSVFSIFSLNVSYLFVGIFICFIWFDDYFFRPLLFWCFCHLSFLHKVYFFECYFMLLYAAIYHYFFIYYYNYML